jgi:hypothetical protein
MNGVWFDLNEVAILVTYPYNIFGINTREQNVGNTICIG